MNQTEKMRELCPTCGEIEPRTGNCGTSENDNRALCKKALAAENIPDAKKMDKPKKLVRLTRYDSAEIELDCTDKETGLLDAEKFANAIQDALEAINIGNL